MTEENVNPDNARGMAENSTSRTKLSRRETLQIAPFVLRRILVPTDFSGYADRALGMAAELCRRCNAQLIVLHAYHMPFTDEHMPPDMVKELLDVQRNRAEETILEYSRRQETVLSGLQVQYRSVMGFAGETILDIAEKEGVDLIVLGTQGANSLEDRLFGTVTWNTIKKSHIPVLALPDAFQAGAFNRMMVPFEGTEQDYNIIGFLLGLAEKFNATVHAVHFLNDAGNYQKSLVERLQNGFRKEIEQERLQLHFLAEKNITEGIRKFAARNQVDMIGMVTHNHGLFSTIFHMSVTRNIALYGEIPLLAYNCDKL